MPWFKVDDSFHSHPKVMELSVEAVGLWTLAGTWCANYLTDGVIKESVLHRFGRTSANVRELCAELVESGLWEETSPGTYQYRNWSEYQPVKDDVEAEREAARERMRQVRAKKKGSKRSEDVQANNSRSSEEVRVTPTRPDPTIKEPSSEVAKAPIRPEVQSLLDHFDSNMESNGAKKPTRSKANLDAMRLLIDKDGYTPEQIIWIMNWSANHEFWRSNILSPAKLREKFDQLKLKAGVQPTTNKPLKGFDF